MTASLPRSHEASSDGVPSRVHRGAKHPLCRECDRKKPLFRTGRCGQPQSDRHAGAVTPDWHRHRRQPEIIDATVLRTMRRLTRR
jgi:hypothetical protein